MNAPRYFQHEVSLIDPGFFVIFNPLKERWQIRVWTKHRERRDQFEFDRCRFKSTAILTVADYDEDHQDVGYRPLDARTLYAVKRSRKNADDPSAVLREIDESNKKLEEEFDVAAQELAKEVAVSTWKHYKEPFFDLGK